VSPQPASATATAFVVVVPEAEPRLASLRSRFDPSAALGVPAHITVLHPFMPPAMVTPEVLERAATALRGLGPFDFVLAQVARFPGVLYLEPQPAAPFVALTEALVRAFPRYPPFGGAHDSIVPHLTVAQGDELMLQQAETELRAALQAQGPVAAPCRELCLMHNAGGPWVQWQRLPLHIEGAPLR
jgi:2'-5' RNA ligase